MKYDAIPAVRRSDLWELRKSPAHYLYAVTHEKAQSPTLAFGTAAHKYILKTDDFFNHYAVAPVVDRRTKAGKAEWAQFVEELDEKQSVSIDDYNTILKMDKAICEHPTARALIKTGVHELPMEWTDPETGEPCKCRPDVLTQYQGVDYIVDYKTTTSCEDGAFERACRMYGYKLQAAMYSEGVFNVTLQGCRFAFVAQEKTPPYAVRVYFCDEGFVDEGMEQFRKLIGIYHECKETGVWPGYPDRELVGDE